MTNMKFLFQFIQKLQPGVTGKHIPPYTTIPSLRNSMHQHLNTIAIGKFMFLHTNTTKFSTFCVETTGLHLFSDKSYSQFLVL